MERTPIKIPGKNTRDQSKAGRAASKALKRPPGRPPKLKSAPKTDASDISIQTVSVSKKRSLKHIKSRRKMSNLEKLPTELLVEIFLYCMNIDLPRSSPVIGGKLTSELIYIRTVIEAFGPTWNEEYGNYKPGIETYHDDYYPLSGFVPESVPQKRGVGDAVLQSAILRCRWASLHIIQKSQEVWIDRYCKERPFKPLPFLVHHDIDVEKELQKTRLERKLTPAKYLDEDFEAFSSDVRGENVDSDFKRHWTTYVDVANGLEIPESLLLGPWTEEMVRYLYWLVRGGAELNWLTSTSGEAAMLGLKTAVTEGELRVIHLLFWAGLSDRVGIETVVWVIHNAAQNRFKVVEEVMKLWVEKHDIDVHEGSLLEEACQEVKEKAVAESDKEGLALLEALRALGVMQ